MGNQNNNNTVSSGNFEGPKNNIKNLSSPLSYRLVLLSRRIQNLEDFEKHIHTSEPLSGFSIAVYVDPEGNDTTGDGSPCNPYKTLFYANTRVIDASINNPVVIILGPGIYVEKQIQLKPYIVYKGTADISTIIKPINPNIPLLLGIDNAQVDFLTIAEVTNSAGIYFNTVGIFRGINIAIVDCKYGIWNDHANAVLNIQIVSGKTVSGTITDLIKCTSGRIEVQIISIYENSNIETIAKVEGVNTRTIIGNLLAVNSNITNVFYVDNLGLIMVHSSNIENATNGFRIGVNGGSIITRSICVMNTTCDLLIEGTPAIFRGSSNNISRDKINAVVGASIENFGYDAYTGTYRFFGDLRVGKEGVGNDSSFGEGGAYQYNVKVLSWNGIDFVDVTTNNDIEFPNVNPNTALYFGDLDTNLFYGLRYLMGNQAIDLGAGSIVWEYYDGGTATWVAFDTLNTLYNFSNSTQNISFGGIDGNQYIIRFDGKIEKGVIENNVSATGWITSTEGGFLAYWVRCRIVVGITTSPKISSVFLKGNYTKIRKNGTIAFSGEARALQNLKFFLGNGVGTTAAQSILISGNISLLFRKNRFASSADDSLFFTTPILEEMDTSFGIRFIFKGLTPTTVPVGGGKTTFRLYYSTVKEGDLLDGSRVDTEIAEEFNFTKSPDETDKQKEFRFAHRINIANAEVGDLLALRLRRRGNDIGDDPDNLHVDLDTVFIEYNMWQKGAYCQ